VEVPPSEGGKQDEEGKKGIGREHGPERLGQQLVEPRGEDRQLVGVERKDDDERRAEPRSEPDISSVQGAETLDYGGQGSIRTFFGFSLMMVSISAWVTPFAFSIGRILVIMWS